MRRNGRLKNLIWVIAGMMIIVCILSFPILYFKRIDASRYNTRHYMEKITFSLDTDAQNVLMVGALHRILNSPYQFNVTYNTELVQEDYVILTENAGSDVETEIVSKNNGVLILYYDKVTNKVIQAQYKPNNYNQEKYMRKLCTEKGNQKIQKKLNRFLKYLGLDIIDDWLYTGTWEFYSSENNVFGKTKLDVYDEVKKSGDEDEEFQWYMFSNSAKLALYAEPEKDGVKYFFKVYNVKSIS